VGAKDYFDKYYVVVDDAPPYKIFEKWNGDQGYSGVYVDTLKEVSVRTGLEFEFVNVPFSRGLAMMSSGQADMMLGSAWNPENARIMVYLNASFPEERVTLLISDTTPDIRYYDDLQDLTIGVLRAGRFFDPFDSDTSLLKYEITNFEEGARMLKHHRIDAMIIPERLADHMLLRPNTSLRKASFSALGPRAYITISRKSGLLERKGEIEKAFANLNSEDYFARLMKVYLLQ
jgi:polar amino acid transport system substrate-binding protein